MILLIDNYDSFSYNLVQMAGSINPDIKVIRNDELTVEEIEKLHPDKIILSPGPGYPKDAGVCEEVVQKLQGKFPIMGVCLGHQAICEAYGGEIIHAKELMHGKKSNVKIDTASPIFQGMPEEINAARYHSLAADTEKIPKATKTDRSHRFIRFPQDWIIRESDQSMRCLQTKEEHSMYRSPMKKRLMHLNICPEPRESSRQ